MLSGRKLCCIFNDTDDDLNKKFKKERCCYRCASLSEKKEYM